MSDVAREFLENSLERTQGNVGQNNNTSNLFSAERNENSENRSSEPSVYTMASDQSQLSRDLDHWLRGSTERTESSGDRGIRSPRTQRSTTPNMPPLENNGLWYFLALVFPLFSISNYPQFRCSPSAVINTAEVILSHVGRFCDRIRCNVRRLAQNQMSRELLATAMDILLFVYAIGFLVLSMYQASIIG